VVDFHRGIAVKPSLLGVDRQERRAGLFRLYSAALLSGLDLFVIDSEGAQDDFSVSDIAELVRLAEDVEGPTVVPTIPVRRSDYEERIREFVESLAGSSRAGLCIVAGNPHYLSEEEAARRAGPLLMEAAALSRARLGDLPIMVGTENVESAALKCCMRHRCMPFFLLDEGVENFVESYRNFLDVPVAVYAPFFIGDDLSREAEETIMAYASRRRRLSVIMKNSGNSHEALKRLMLIGDRSMISERLREMWLRGFDFVVGFPASRVEAQIYLFGGVTF
jgi:hypothetical protein